MHSFRKYVNPHLGELLEIIKMDKEFTRGEGSFLYDKDNNQYLDCISNYGAVPFGYNPPEIWNCIKQIEQTGEPSLVKPSALNAAGELAKTLINLTPPPLKYVTFANSGAEAVEAAFKLCRSSTGRQGILTTDNSFHGKTLGALSATGNEDYQKGFGAPTPGYSFIKYGDLKALEQKLHNNPEKFAAFIVEPIQGEGGIIIPPPDYLKQAHEICKEYGVFFILDEVQTGLGRTGSLFAFEQEDVTPDILLLAKALGGGMIPIGACISSDEVYNEDFANKHSSTFAGNTLACRIGITVLEKLTRNDLQLVKDVKRKGEIFLNKLIELKNSYPNVVKEIRGRGFMIGMEFKANRYTLADSLLGIMADQELLTPVISSHLLNQEKIRVAPTLNGNNVIRIEPPLTMTLEQCLSSLQGFENMLKTLNQGNTASFISHLIDTGDKKFPDIESTQKQRIYPADNKEEGRFAFLIHPLDLKNYCEFDKSLDILSKKELAQLTERWNNIVEPFIVSETRITSASGNKAYGEFISIPRTTRQLLNMTRQDSLNMVKDAIKMAQDRGAKIVGLGAYTSVVTMGGLYVRNEGIPVTTGNSYTVVAAVEAVINALDKLEVAPEYSTAAIVGATGSIGKGSAILISQSVSRLILVGNPAHAESSKKRLYKIAGEIYKYLSKKLAANVNFKKDTIGYKLEKVKGLPAASAPLNDFVQFARNQNSNNSPIIVTTSIENTLPRADVTICATNTMDKLITPDHLKQGAIICDISRPKNVSQQIEEIRPDVLVIDGGVIEVPDKPSMGWNFGFEKGLVYACMAETMMLALDHHYQNTSLGSSGVNLDSILYTRHLSQKHGFKLATLRSFDRPLSEKRWQKIIQARQEQVVNI